MTYMKSLREMAPHALLDALIESQHLKNDAALSRFLGISPVLASKVRNRVLPVSASLILLIHDCTDMPIRDIKALVAEAEQQVAEKQVAA